MRFTTEQNTFYRKIHGTFLRENSSNFYARNNQGQLGKHKRKKVKVKKPDSLKICHSRIRGDNKRIRISESPYDKKNSRLKCVRIA